MTEVCLFMALWLAMLGGAFYWQWQRSRKDKARHFRDELRRRGIE